MPPPRGAARARPPAGDARTDYCTEFPPSGAEEAFLAWLESRGAKHACAFAALPATGGRGVVAARELRANEAVVEIPDKLALTADNCCLKKFLRMAGFTCEPDDDEEEGEEGEDESGSEGEGSDGEEAGGADAGAGGGACGAGDCGHNQSHDPHDDPSHGHGCGDDSCGGCGDGDEPALPRDSRREGVGLALAVAAERARGEKSGWAPYLNVLPRTLPGLPLFWPPEDMAALGGTSVADKMSGCERVAAAAPADAGAPAGRGGRARGAGGPSGAALGRRWEAAAACSGLEPPAEPDLLWRGLAAPFLRESPPLRGLRPTAAGRGAFEWALAMVSGYSFCLGDYRIQAMVPMWDMLNHVTGQANVRLHHDAARGALQMIATRPIRRGEELVNCYGDRSSAELLLAHGYVENHDATVRNPHEAAEVPLAALVRAALVHEQAQAGGRGGSAGGAAKRRKGAVTGVEASAGDAINIGEGTIDADASEGRLGAGPARMTARLRFLAEQHVRPADGWFKLTAAAAASSAGGAGAGAAGDEPFAFLRAAAAGAAADGAGAGGSLGRADAGASADGIPTSIPLPPAMIECARLLLLSPSAFLDFRRRVRAWRPPLARPLAEAAAAAAAADDAGPAGVSGSAATPRGGGGGVWGGAEAAGVIGAWDGGLGTTMCADSGPLLPTSALAVGPAGAAGSGPRGEDIPPGLKLSLEAVIADRLARLAAGAAAAAGAAEGCAGRQGSSSDAELRAMRRAAAQHVREAEASCLRAAAAWLAHSPEAASDAALVARGAEVWAHPPQAGAKGRKTPAG